jgi:hypothetical protein
MQTPASFNVNRLVGAAHGRTPLIVVAENLTGIRYRDEIVQPYVIPFIQAQANIHPKHAQWVNNRVKLLDMVTNQHFAVSDSHALLAQHVVERCPAEM